MTDAVANTAGKTKTEAVYWRCSVAGCGHREWAAAGDYQEFIKNPAPMRGGIWRFREKIEAVWCQCQAKTDKIYRPRTMKLYRTTIWLAPGESLPNIGIHVTLNELMRGKNPIPVSDIDDPGVEEIPTVAAVVPVAPSPLLVEQGRKIAAEDDPDAVFDLKTGTPSQETKPL